MSGLSGSGGLGRSLPPRETRQSPLSGLEPTTVHKSPRSPDPAGSSRHESTPPCAGASRDAQAPRATHPPGSDIGHVADVLSGRARDCSHDAMDVVPHGGGTASAAIPAGRSGREIPPPEANAGHLADDRATGPGHDGTNHGPRTRAPARDTTRPAWACGPLMTLGRSVMKRIRIGRRRVRGERPWLEALPLDPRDPDIVRAKELARTTRSGEAPGT